MSSSFDTENETPEFENLAKLAENMVFRLPGCDDVMVRKYLASSYRDFCKRTCAIKSVRKIAVEKGVLRYYIAPRMPDCIIDCVTSVRIGGREVMVGRYRLDASGIWFDQGVLPQTDDEKVEVEIECVEIPKISSEKVPCGFLDRYGDAITSGALCGLYAMTGKPWSDPAQSAFCGSEYENAITEARSRHHSGGTISSGNLNFYKKGLVL